ncbi:MAG TPA: SRPBCC domain-containing protein [Puia sp.]|nr:SRPBCC domain-containing protein [Puia sp.]
MMKREAVFTKDFQSKKITVVREFDAPLDLVWKAWTDSAILDQWWAPRPWRAETKKMDFRAGGKWLYNMIGPDGNGAWCVVAFHKVDANRGFSSSAAFCDEAGNTNSDFPVMEWQSEFSQTGGVTTVRVEISFAKEADMQTIIAMRFLEGFAMGLGNLEEYLQAHVPA